MSRTAKKAQANHKTVVGGAGNRANQRRHSRSKCHPSPFNQEINRGELKWPGDTSFVLLQGVGFKNDFDAFVRFFHECLVTERRVVQCQPVRDDKRRIDLVFLNFFQQRFQIPLHVRLACANGQRFGDHKSKGDFVQETCINSGHRNRRLSGMSEAPAVTL